MFKSIWRRFLFIARWLKGRVSPLDFDDVDILMALPGDYRRQRNRVLVAALPDEMLSYLEGEGLTQWECDVFVNMLKGYIYLPYSYAAPACERLAGCGLVLRVGLSQSGGLTGYVPSGRFGNRTYKLHRNPASPWVRVGGDVTFRPSSTPGFSLNAPTEQH